MSPLQYNAPKSGTWSEPLSVFCDWTIQSYFLAFTGFVDMVNACAPIAADQCVDFKQLFKYSLLLEDYLVSALSSLVSLEMAHCL